MLNLFSHSKVDGKLLNFSHMIKKFNPNERSCSPSFISLSKDKLPLPCLTPGLQRKINYGVSSGDSKEKPENPFMK